MRKTSLIISAAAGLALAQAAQADQLFYEPFNEPVSPNPTSWTIKHEENGYSDEQDELASNFPYGSGQTTPQPIPTWIDAYSGNPTPYVGSGNLTYPGLLNLNPNSNNATFHGDQTNGSLTGKAYHYLGQPAYYTGPALDDQSTPSPFPYMSYPPNPATPTTLYYSVLLRVTQVGSAGGTTVTGGNGTTYNQSSDGWKTNNSTTGTGQAFMGFTDNTSYVSTRSQQADSAGDLMIRPGADALNTGTFSTTFQLGIGATTGGTYPTSGTNYTLGQAVFAVVAYTMNPSTNDNVAKLYLNPTPGTAEAANTVAAQTPAGAADIPNPITAFELGDFATLPDYGLQIDELRVGTSWSDVAAWATPGDANDNGTVNSDDFDVLAANFGKTAGMNWNTGDFNNDGIVNALDFNALATNWGSNVAASEPLSAIGSIVPEPSSALLLLLGASGLLAGRRRHRVA